LALAATFLVFPRAKWPYWVTLAMMPAFLLYTLWATPGLTIAAFNPVSTNIAMAALALIALTQLSAPSPHSSQP
jgi:hypothetical protein